jgi:superfamily I DNA and/or RNA helicase
VAIPDDAVHEQEVIVLHMVSAKENARSDPFGFVKEERRLCVALSRAQSYFFIVSNFTHRERTQRSFNWKDKGMKNFMKETREEAWRVDWPTDMEDLTEG